MSSADLLKEALHLKPYEKLSIIEGLLKSLDEPNKNLDEIWADEAERRLNAYRSGQLKGIAFEEIFEDSEQ